MALFGCNPLLLTAQAGNEKLRTSNQVGEKNAYEQRNQCLKIYVVPEED